jgi:hypothetical protein
MIGNVRTPLTNQISDMTCKLTHRVMTQPNDPPVIKGAPSFVGLGVFSTDEYVPNGGTGPDGNAKEWYINTVRPAV